MLSITSLHLTLAAVGIALWCLYSVIGLCIPYVKRFRRSALIFIVSSLVLIRVVIVTPVSIVNDNNSVQQFAVLFPTHIELSDGKLALIKPNIGLSHEWIVNNGSKSLFFETVLYGTGQDFVHAEIAGYSTLNVSTLDYLFVAPPGQVKLRSMSAVKGWLYR